MYLSFDISFEFQDFLGTSFLDIQNLTSTLFQKQPSRGVLNKRCSENMQQIYRRTPMPKCNFNKVALHGFFLFLTGCLFRSSPPEVFVGKGVLKICTGENPCKKVLCNFIEIAFPRRFSPANLLRILGILFHKSTYGGLPLSFLLWTIMTFSFFGIQISLPLC